MTQEFLVKIKLHEGINGAYVEIPFDVQQVFGAKRVKVLATFDGYPYRGSIVTMGGCTMIGITQKIRKIIGKGEHDEVLVTVEKDTEERIVPLPDDLAEKFDSSPIAQAFYQSLSYTNKKRCCDYIENAKQEQTRKKRLEETIEKLSNHQKI